MTAKDAVEIGSALLALAGVAAGIRGTFLLTRLYHSYDVLSFIRTIVKVVGLTLIGDTRRTLARARAATKAGAFTPEEKAESLVGVYWIFIGFVLQGVAVALSLGDTIWSIATRH
jgi:hypothetical protein